LIEYGSREDLDTALRKLDDTKLRDEIIRLYPVKNISGADKRDRSPSPRRSSSPKRSSPHNAPESPRRDRSPSPRCAPSKSRSRSRSPVPRED
jgi:hypothetical protein